MKDREVCKRKRRYDSPMEADRAARRGRRGKPWLALGDDQAIQTQGVKIKARAFFRPRRSNMENDGFWEDVGVAFRREFLDKFAELWAKHPDQRFGQLVYNLMRGEGLFGINDELATRRVLDAINYGLEVFLEREVKGESGPLDWVDVTLRVSPNGEMYAVGGEREPGEGDTAFPGLERIKKRIGRLRESSEAAHVALNSHGVAEYDDHGKKKTLADRIKALAEDVNPRADANGGWISRTLVHRFLDDAKVPRKAENGNEYTINGRIRWLADTAKRLEEQGLALKKELDGRDPAAEQFWAMMQVEPSIETRDTHKYLDTVLDDGVHGGSLIERVRSLATAMRVAEDRAKRGLEREREAQNDRNRAHGALFKVRQALGEYAPDVFNTGVDLDEVIRDLVVEQRAATEQLGKVREELNKHIPRGDQAKPVSELLRNLIIELRAGIKGYSDEIESAHRALSETEYAGNRTMSLRTRIERLRDTHENEKLRLERLIANSSVATLCEMTGASDPEALKRAIKGLRQRYDLVPGSGMTIFDKLMLMIDNEVSTSRNHAKRVEELCHEVDDVTSEMDARGAILDRIQRAAGEGWWTGVAEQLEQVREELSIDEDKNLFSAIEQEMELSKNKSKEIAELKKKLNEARMAIPEHDDPVSPVIYEGDWLLRLDKYRRDNLVWLLRLAHIEVNGQRPLSFTDSGDWHGEILQALQGDFDQDMDVDPNVDDTQTRRHLEELAAGGKVALARTDALFGIDALMQHGRMDRTSIMRSPAVVESEVEALCNEVKLAHQELDKHLGGGWMYQKDFSALRKLLAKRIQSLGDMFEKLRTSDGEDPLRATCERIRVLCQRPNLVDLDKHVELNVEQMHKAHRVLDQFGIEHLSLADRVAKLGDLRIDEARGDDGRPLFAILQGIQRVLGAPQISSLERFVIDYHNRVVQAHKILDGLDIDENLSLPERVAVLKNRAARRIDVGDIVAVTLHTHPKRGHDPVELLVNVASLTRKKD